MRTIFTAALFGTLPVFALPMAGAWAGPVATSKDAIADAMSDGYARIALTERTPKGWDLWASKDGVAYELRIDGRTGALLQTIPLDNDD